MPIVWVVMSLCGRSIGLTAMHNVQDHPRSKYGTLVSLVCSRFGQLGSTKTAGWAGLVVKWLVRNIEFLGLTSYPAGHINLFICRDVYCGYQLWWIALLRLSITIRSKRTLWWSCVWKNFHNECEQPMQATQIHKSSAPIQEENSWHCFHFLLAHWNSRHVFCNRILSAVLHELELQWQRFFLGRSQ